MTRASLQFKAGSHRLRSWGRKNEEYIADFVLVAKRTLSPKEYRVFNYHFLLGGDWKLCSRKLKIDRGAFFHYVYRIERKLGRVYCELEPYSLFPLDEYFETEIQPAEPIRMPGLGELQNPPIHPPIHPPLQHAA